jgi:hypothetical protein
LALKNSARFSHVVLVSLFGQPIVWSISNFFGLKKNEIVQSQRPDSLFLSTILNFFVQSFLKIGHPFNQRLEKKSREWTKRNCPVSETGQFLFGRPKKKEKLTGQLVSQETDQHHIDVPNMWISAHQFW